MLMSWRIYLGITEGGDREAGIRREGDGFRICPFLRVIVFVSALFSSHGRFVYMICLFASLSVWSLEKEKRATKGKSCV
jgi:hypothetical protein